MNLTREEKENILDKHKSLYNGYAVRQNQSNMSPLYTQDFANDKEGITVNSNGEVSTYNNKIYMKESKNICSECGLYEDVCECGSGGMYEEMCNECGGEMMEGECMECGNNQVKGIGDKFDYTEDEDEDLALAIGAEGKSNMALAMDEDECMECGDMYEDDKDIDDVMSEIKDEIEFSDETEKIKESLQESLNWFKKFKYYN
jgi:hypothetical protein